jgi:hypothetical protein
LRRLPVRSRSRAAGKATTTSRVVAAKRARVGRRVKPERELGARVERVSARKGARPGHLRLAEPEAVGVGAAERAARAAEVGPPKAAVLAMERLPE